jgi:hypothetical protein
MRWLITNRNIEANGFGTKFADLTYWTLKAPGLPLDVLSSWDKKTADDFKALLVQTSNQFPVPVDIAPENQKHICLFIHGYNTWWTDAMGFNTGHIMC